MSESTKKWVGLTDEEIEEIESISQEYFEWIGFYETVKMIEKKLKEKNT